MDNTSRNQDIDISAAQGYAQDADTHVSNLVSIIEYLDSELTAWKEITEHDDPKAVVAKIDTLKARIEELEAARE